MIKLRWFWVYFGENIFFGAMPRIRYIQSTWRQQFLFNFIKKFRHYIFDSAEVSNGWVRPCRTQALIQRGWLFRLRGTGVSFTGDKVHSVPSFIPWERRPGTVMSRVQETPHVLQRGHFRHTKFLRIGFSFLGVSGPRSFLELTLEGWRIFLVHTQYFFGFDITFKYLIALS